MWQLFRQDAAMSKSEEKQPVHLELPSLSDTIKGHPLFGNLNPFDILQHLLKQSKFHYHCGVGGQEQLSRHIISVVFN